MTPSLNSILAFGALLILAYVAHYLRAERLARLRRRNLTTIIPSDVLARWAAKTMRRSSK
jgi:hypothetical protein